MRNHGILSASLLPLEILSKAKTMLRLVNIMVDLDAHERRVRGLKRYRAATVEGDIGDCPLSIFNLGIDTSFCCLIRVISDKLCAIKISTVL